MSDFIILIDVGRGQRTRNRANRENFTSWKYSWQYFRLIWRLLWAIVMKFLQLKDANILRRLYNLDAFHLFLTKF